MKTIRVYDIPTRLLHALFAGLFLGAFAIGKWIDDDSALFSVHMLLGLMLAVTVGLRIVWGLFGSHHARFANMPLRPQQLWHYFRSLFTAASPRDLGHNPASAWGGLLMLLLALGLATTGILMTQGGSEALEEIHELLANAFLIVVLAHIAGLALHTLRHRDNIAASMFNGHKQRTQNIPTANVSPHMAAGIGMMIILAACGWYLSTHFDSTTRQLTLPGTTLQLGEAEEHESNATTHNSQKHDDDRDGDDD